MLLDSCSNDDTKTKRLKRNSIEQILFIKILVGVLRDRVVMRHPHLGAEMYSNKVELLHYCT